jgi:hypothetical protein
MYGSGKKGRSSRNQRRARVYRHIREVRQLVIPQSSTRGTRPNPTLTYNEIARGIQRRHNAAREPQTTKKTEDYNLKMEAVVQNNIEDKRARWHVPCHGNMKEDRPDGVFRLMEGQPNSAATSRTRDRWITDLDRIIQKWDVQGGGFSEVGINWSCLPRTQQLDSWFWASHEEVRTSTAHNENKSKSVGQPGGIGLFACKDLMQYICSSSSNTRKLGRWNSWSVYADSNHHTRIVVAYQVGANKLGEKTIYCQHKCHILERGLGINLEPRELFQKDLL